MQSSAEVEQQLGRRFAFGVRTSRAMRSFDPSPALRHLEVLRGRLCPLPLVAGQSIAKVAAIGLGLQHADLALLILAQGHGLRLIDPDEGRLKSLLRRIALEQEYALWAGDMTGPERERLWRAISCYSDIAACKAGDLALWGDPKLAPNARWAGSAASAQQIPA